MTTHVHGDAAAGALHVPEMIGMRAIVFLGLFFLTVGLDEIANPRLRRMA